MNKAILEQEAKKLFGGATIDVKPFQDDVNVGWDITIIPFLDKGTRFIRLPSAQGMPGAIAYLKKIQENLLNLNRSGVLGIRPIEIPVDEEKIGEEIAKRMPKENMKPTYACTKCEKKFKYPGPLAMHQKTHKERPISVAKSANDSLIYEMAK